MSEHGTPPPQRPRQPPPQHNAYDYAPPPYQPPYAARLPTRIDIDPANIYISIAKAIAIVVPLVLGLLYANNMLKDFQRETQVYQQGMQEKMSSLIAAMRDMTTARDLSDFCMQAQTENPSWKCPGAFQWRRQGYYQPAERDRRGVTTIQLGER
jgi:hypothetical protein